MENAFGSMDVMLKKRYDLIPNLVATVQQYMQHEAGVLKEVTELRARELSGPMASDDAVALNNQIGKALSGIMVAVENYPDLKASENFQQLQQSLNEVEEQISASRRTFNASVTDYNNAEEHVRTPHHANHPRHRADPGIRRRYAIRHGHRRRPQSQHAHMDEGVGYCWSS